MSKLENINTISQESLQPQSLCGEDKAYQSILDIEERLRKQNATNIALTGPYGSGKSSIIITLRNKFLTYKYQNLSLATLKPSETISLADGVSENEYENE